MSGGLAPSKSTVYLSNIPFSLTNNDIYKIMEKHGKVVKVTIVKDKETRQSKGVAFILFLDRTSAHNCVRAMNNTPMFGRTVKCSIAKDNGRTTEFIRRRDYPDKSRCYECGEFGHLSFQCPNNLLGEREPPKKKDKKKRKNKDDAAEYGASSQMEEKEEEEEEEIEDPALDTLAAAIQYQQHRIEEDDYRYRVTTGEYSGADGGSVDTADTRKRFKKSEYFSDEEEEDEART
ncbi:PREDICTED: zinc finger CCHC-type and RNA-binding motif-containing protein 1-like [Priapulus caudatus]|uniref:Zinc finger CCHC-type and RNA-binding motif-containing protein 1 n=1 Tax=Priapulus caudatus TaxID=37621 RepID=A0ABM1EN14_PRICU|nr:PREDICTED: zinc finger CCHC-type and RNA-binding motif-containing protein 1-like [Priapulus caudatus]